MSHASCFKPELLTRSALALNFLFLSGLAFAQSAPLSTNFDCRWSAQLTAARPGSSAGSSVVADPGSGESYAVPFDLDIEHSAIVPSLVSSAGGPVAALLNGGDRIVFSSAAVTNNQLVLHLDQYDAELSAHCTSGPGACRTLAGEYVRQRGSTASRYAVTARCLPPTAAPASGDPNPAPSTYSIAGDWQFTFTSPNAAAEPEFSAPAHFTAAANHVEGTIAPISGDYGMLSGTLDAANPGELHLSRFDGIHMLRLDGHFVSPDRIEGVFHEAIGHPLTFVAIRSATARGFDEAEHLTSVENPAEPFRFHGVNASGATVTQDDPAFRGQVVLVDIFGTWCPNCHDEAPILQSLYARFHGRGLQVVGLSYEYVDDSARSQRLIGIYRSKYSIEFPLLLAGTTGSGQIAATLPQLRNFGAYPTTIFLDRHGRVRLIHAGFSGPATGRLDEIRQSFERTIVKLLDEP
jgi:thiol-disulfide isomerase/thioredoxin